MNSFRLRLAFLVGATTAALLLTVGFFAWRLTTRFYIDRVDRELRQIAKTNLERIGDASHWERVDDALVFVSGADHRPTYVLSVRNYDREEYRSPSWPTEIHPERFPVPETYEGGLRFTRLPPPPRREEISPRNPALPSKEPYFLTQEANGSTWRVGIMGNPYTTLVLAVNLDEFDADLQRLRRTYLTALPLVLLLLGGWAWFLATRALRPVLVLTQAAERMTAKGLDQRIAEPTRDVEFHRLVTVFNEMMDRLEQAFHQARRFSADASHELRTPLALLQAEIEQAMHTAPNGSPEQQTYTSLLEEIHHLKAILEKLLLLSLADSGRLALQCVPSDLSQMIANVAEDCQAQSASIRVETDIETGIQFNADPTLLEQALQNLASNAVKYNQASDGVVRFELRSTQNQIVVRISNTGQPISEEDRKHIFERFYRADPSRNRAKGLGLGLSLSREIVRAHKGELVIEPAVSKWTVFCATLPR